MIHLSISLCFQHLNKKKLVRQLLLMVFFMMFQKTSNFSHRYLYSIRHPSKIWESSFCSPKKTWVLKFQSLVLAILNSPRYKEIRLVRIDGVVQTYTHHFRSTFGTGCISAAATMIRQHMIQRTVNVQIFQFCICLEQVSNLVNIPCNLVERTICSGM